MELNDRVTQLEDEIKIMKNEVQAVLLDLRESYLNGENPFSPGMPSVAAQPIIINQPAPAARREREDDATPEENPESKLTESEEPDSDESELADEPPELDSETALGDEPEQLDAGPEPACEPEEETIAGEEVKRAWRPAIKSGPHFGFKETTSVPDDAIGVATMAKLAQWVDKAVKQLGRERVEAVLDISEMMGHLTPDLKNILAKFIDPTAGEFSEKVTTRDYLASIIELENLLGRRDKSEMALLYILCQENDHR